MAKKADEWSEEYIKEVTWKIPNFWDLTRREVYFVSSPEFRLANATWFFLAFKDSVWDRPDTLCVIRRQSPVPEHRVRYKTVLKSCFGDEYHSRSDEHTLVKNDGRVCVFPALFRMIAERRLILPDGTLKMICELRVKEATEEASNRPQQNLNEPPPIVLREASTQTEVHESVNQATEEEASTSVQKLLSDYSKLLKSEEDSDVCLKVSDKEFRAHRCILRARSTVFSAMFKHDLEEKASGEVVIDDLDPDSFPDFLQHVYAGRVDSLTSENVSSLYLAADKYDLQELKSECRDYLKLNLSVDTFCDVVTLALRHQEAELLDLATDFFSKNLRKIIVTVKWQAFSKDHNTEANELFIKALGPGEINESM